MRTAAERMRKSRYIKEHGITSAQYEELFYPPELRLKTRRKRADIVPLTKLERNRKHKYGVTREQVYAMLDDQDNKCAICGVELSYEKMHVDHCHDTGKVRGLLCRRCNLAVGYIESLLPVIEKVQNYLSL